MFLLVLSLFFGVLAFRALGRAEVRCSAMKHALAKQDYAETLRNGTVNFKCVQFYDGMPPADVALCLAGLVAGLALARSGAIDWGTWKRRQAERRRFWETGPGTGTGPGDEAGG